MIYHPILMYGLYGDHSLNKLKEKNLKIGQDTRSFDETEELLLIF